MRILFDQGTPAPLRKALGAHAVETAFERGWSELENGALISAAESEGFELLITTDTNLRYQQNLSGRSIAVLVLSTPSWPRIRKVSFEISVAVGGVSAGQFLEFEVR